MSYLSMMEVHSGCNPCVQMVLHVYLYPIISELDHLITLTLLRVVNVQHPYLIEVSE